MEGAANQISGSRSQALGGRGASDDNLATHDRPGATDSPTTDQRFADRVGQRYSQYGGRRWCPVRKVRPTLNKCSSN